MKSPSQPKQTSLEDPQGQTKSWIKTTVLAALLCVVFLFLTSDGRNSSLAAGASRHMAVSTPATELSVCIPARGFGSVSVPRSGTLAGMTLTHVSGELNFCGGNRRDDCEGNWGTKSAGLGLYVTNTQRLVLFPQPPPTSVFYHDGVNVYNANTFTFSGGNAAVTAGQTLWFWEGETLKDSQESDNVGTVCAKVVFHYEIPLAPVYEFFNPYKGRWDHLYTNDKAEIGAHLQPGQYGLHGYYYIGAFAYLSPSPEPGLVPLYRYWYIRQTDTYLTTTQQSVSGRVYRGIIGYCSPTQKYGAVPWYESFNGHLADHYYSFSPNPPRGFYHTAIACYVWKTPTAVLKLVEARVDKDEN